jgi:hypothetical protein
LRCSIADPRMNISFETTLPYSYDTETPAFSSCLSITMVLALNARPRDSTRQLISHFVAVVWIDSHSTRKCAKCLFLAVGALNRSPLFRDLADASIVNHIDAVQNHVDELRERISRGVRVELVGATDDELARHVRHRHTRPLALKCLVPDP